MARKLPKPGSAALKKLLPGVLHQTIYEVLYETRSSPPTMAELRAQVRARLGADAADQTHFNKRVRELRDHFDIPSAAANRGVYKLEAQLDRSKANARLSKSMRAEVLRNKRCEMCGKTPGADGIRLHVDHEIPREWGGSSEPDNLQALCSECNEGKKAYFSTFDEHTAKIRAAIAFDEPHKRIGELLKAFAPGEVRSDLIEVVASAHQFQADWRKRLRELRELGWVITPRRKKDAAGRTRVFWRLEHSEPWPQGKAVAEIRRRERQRRLLGSR